MINNLTEKEILDYLMTSEFSEGLTPDESIFLLVKFRYFYRILAGKNETIKSDLVAKIKEIDDIKLHNSELVKKMTLENESLERQVSLLENRSLSLRERLTGKITKMKNETI